MKIRSFADQNKVRGFIALTLPDHIKNYLTKLQNHLKKQEVIASWTDPSNSHLTLKFLGEIDFQQQEEVIEAMKSSSRKYQDSSRKTTPSGIKLYTCGLGVFLNYSKPGIIWSGLKGQKEELLKLHSIFESNLSRIGFKKEKKIFTPHLTIGRIKNRSSEKVTDKLKKLIEEYRNEISETFYIRSVKLFKSELFSTGTVHTQIFKCKFIY